MTKTIRDRIIDLFNQHPADQYTNAYLATALRVPTPSVRRESAKLVKDGKLVRLGERLALPSEATQAPAGVLPLPATQRELVVGQKYNVLGQTAIVVQGPDKRLDSVFGKAKKACLQTNPDFPVSAFFERCRGDADVLYLQLV